MAFSQAFLEWEQKTEQRGVQKGLEQGRAEERRQALEREQALLIRQLIRNPLSSLKH